MKVRRTKPYVCIDIDFADHFRFQSTTDLEAAAGVWLRCLAHSRAQEQDGVVTAAWLRRTFALTYQRVEELVKVGLLAVRDDGDYEIHAYAPRNQTRDMISEERASTRERVRDWRRSSKGSSVTRYKGVTSNAVTNDDPAPASVGRDEHGGSEHIPEAEGSREASSDPCAWPLAPSDSGGFDDVTRYRGVTDRHVTQHENGCNALVPTSINSSLSLSSSDLDPDLSIPPVVNVRAITRAHPPTRTERVLLPPSERSVSGSFWLSAFSEGIAEGTGRPCTVGRVFLGTLERLVTHHAPDRDAPRASVWLKAQAKAFALLWDGKHPAKGLTPDGLERWLNEGSGRPPTFGRPRIVQPPAEEWHEDDWSDLGAKEAE